MIKLTPICPANPYCRLVLACACIQARVLAAAAAAPTTRPCQAPLAEGTGTAAGGAFSKEAAQADVKGSGSSPCLRVVIVPGMAITSVDNNILW